MLTMMNKRLMIKKLIIPILKTSFGLVGWKLWLALHIFDFLWFILVKPIKHELDLRKEKKCKKEALKAFYGSFPKMESKQDFLKHTREMWKKRKEFQSV